MPQPLEPSVEDRLPKKIEKVEEEKRIEKESTAIEPARKIKWADPKTNVQLLYKETPQAVQDVNKNFPIQKSIAQENGWDRFRNTLSKDWAQFSEWCKKHLSWMPGLINTISTFVPFGDAIKTAINAIVKVSEKADQLTGTNNYGKKGGDFSLYDILFIYRNAIVALLFKLAIDYKVPVDTQEFKTLFHTTPEFKKYLTGSKGGDFAQALAKSAGAAEKIITNNDSSKVPQNRKQMQNQASELIRQHEHSKGPNGEEMVVGKKDMYKWLR